MMDSIADLPRSARVAFASVSVPTRTLAKPSPWRAIGRAVQWAGYVLQALVGLGLVYAFVYGMLSI